MKHINKPKYAVGEVVEVKCPDDNCRRIHIGTITELGGLEFRKTAKRKENEILRGLRIYDVTHYRIKYKNNLEKIVGEHDIIKVNVIETMKAIKNG